MKRQKPPIAVIVVLLAVSVPYLMAFLFAGNERAFVGFLLNPIDGASYLAKMYQGWMGSWRFTLPFTAEPGAGAFLFTYYLLLGHLARWLGLPLMLVFHAARLLGAGLLLLALERFYQRIFGDRHDLRQLALWLAVVGSGMGWLVIFLGQHPSDFWVAEAYPFLSMLTSPHFSLGLALLVSVCVGVLEKPSLRRDVLFGLAGLLLAVILPFGEVVALLVVFAWAAWTWLETRCLYWRPVLALGLLGGPFLLYQFWAAQVDPVLAGWNAQNLTPSPPLWDFLLSFSPALLLAFVGLYGQWKQPHSPAGRLLIAWLVLGLLLVYFPFSLQRRFMLGLYIPVAAMAIFGLDVLRQRYPARTRRLGHALFGLALPTNLLLLIVMLFGILSHAPELYITRDEASALSWIQANTPARALILASPQMGQLIPGYTGRRVLYGHPFETVHAEQEQALVKAFYQSRAKIAPGSGMLKERGVDYVLYGPRERALGGAPDLSTLALVYETGAVSIYRVGQP